MKVAEPRPGPDWKSAVLIPEADASCLGKKQPLEMKCGLKLIGNLGTHMNFFEKL